MIGSLEVSSVVCKHIPVSFCDVTMATLKEPSHFSKRESDLGVVVMITRKIWKGTSLQCVND